MRGNPSLQELLRVRCRFCLLAVAALGSALSPALAGETYLVISGGGGDFETIQEAVDFASDGDVIELDNGIFEGDGNRDVDYGGKALTIRSAGGGAMACTIDCGGSEWEPHRGFLFISGEGSGAVLSDVTITHGWGEDGGGILIEDASPTISGCVLAANEALHGGGICIRQDKSSQDPQILACTFLGNLASGGQPHGGGLYCYSDGRGSLTVEDCTFSANSADGTYAIGGGVYCGSCPDATFSDCIFTGNDAPDPAMETGSGGGLYCTYSATTVSGCTFTENTVPFSGGGFFGNHGTAHVDRCTFVRNAADFGGAVWACSDAVLNVTQCTLVENAARYEGGAVGVGCSASAAVSKSILAFGTEGSAIGCSISDPDAVTLSCCVVWENDGGDWIDCIADQLGVDGNLWVDPCFCHASWHIARSSHCHPDNNDCDGGSYIGAWEHGCDECGDDVPVRRVSWGRLRAVFRDR